MEMNEPKFTIKLIVSCGVWYPMLLMGVSGLIAYIMPRSEWWHAPTVMAVVLGVYIANIYMKWYVMKAEYGW